MTKLLPLSALLALVSVGCLSEDPGLDAALATGGKADGLSTSGTSLITLAADWTVSVSSPVVAGKTPSGIVPA